MPWETAADRIFAISVRAGTQWRIDDELEFVILNRIDTDGSLRWLCERPQRQRHALQALAQYRWLPLS